MDTNDMKAHALALAHDASALAHDVVSRAAVYFEFLKSGIALPTPAIKPVQPIRETAPLPTPIPVAVIGDPAPQPPAHEPPPGSGYPGTEPAPTPPAPPAPAAGDVGTATATDGGTPQPA